MGSVSADGGSPFFVMRVKQNAKYHNSYGVHLHQKLVIEQSAVYSQQLRRIFRRHVRGSGL
jgi:hypothetical protein